MSRLARLFDYQKFEPNAELASIISDVESRYADKRQALSDDELEFVAAAGEMSDTTALDSCGAARKTSQRPKNRP